MLLTDRVPNDSQDLLAYESAILDVAHTEGIALDAKLSLARDEIADDILNVLLEHTRFYDPQAADRRAKGVSDVTVTAPLKRWHAAHTIEALYRDAFNNQLNDRYKAKVQEYRELSRRERERTYQFGIGLVSNPIPQAQTPALSYVAGMIPETIYYVQVSWVSAAGQEGAPSDPTTFDSPAGSLPVVTAANPPAIAAGFNVYMGLSADTETLQNSAPVAVGQSFTLAAAGLAAGRAVGTGQTPDYYITGGPMLRRG